MAKKWRNRYAMAQSTKFGTCIVQVNTNIFGGVPEFKGRGQGQVKVKGQNEGSFQVIAVRVYLVIGLF